MQNNQEMYPFNFSLICFGHAWLRKMDRRTFFIALTISNGFVIIYFGSNVFCYEKTLKHTAISLRHHCKKRICNSTSNDIAICTLSLSWKRKVMYGNCSYHDGRFLSPFIWSQFCVDRKSKGQGGKNCCNISCFLRLHSLKLSENPILGDTHIDIVTEIMGYWNLYKSNIFQWWWYQWRV